jgi:GDPmannose 4,6-dehydratase
VRALIVGAAGQDGSYLAEHLIASGHEVFGLTHRSRADTGNQVVGVEYLTGDLRAAASLRWVLLEVRPDEIYDLAGVTSPGGAWGSANPVGLVDVNVNGLVHLLDVAADVVPQARIVHASSSAIYDPHRYGLYGVSKRAAHDIAIGYRRGRGLHVSNAVLYSHTSPRQDPRFLAPTICRKLRDIRDGGTEKLVLTDTLGRRDWGRAADYVQALPLIAHHDTPGDYDVATGRPRSVGEFTDVALAALGLSWRQAVDVVQGIPAPAERSADTAPLRELGWKPATTFEEMVREMVA